MRYRLRTLLKWLGLPSGGDGACVPSRSVADIEWRRLTDRVRKVLLLSNTKAQRLDHEYIGPEHLLLGILKENSGVAAAVLKRVCGDPLRIQLEMERRIVRGPKPTHASRVCPMTPRANRILANATEEARQLNHDFIGTEHVLLAMLRDQESLPVQVLLLLGIDSVTLCREVRSFLGVK